MSRDSRAIPRKSEIGTPADERRGLYPRVILMDKEGSMLISVQAPDDLPYPRNFLDKRCEELSGSGRRRRVIKATLMLAAAVALAALAICIGLSV